MVLPTRFPNPWLPPRSFTSLILIMMAAAVAYAGAAIWLDVDAERETRAHLLIETAQNASARTEHFFQRYQAVFASLVEHDCLRQRNPAVCDGLFERLNRRFPEVVNFAAMDGQGNFFASGRKLPATDPPNTAQFPFFRDLAAGQSRRLMDPHLGPLSGKQVSGVVVPLHDTQGRFDGAIGVSLPFAELQRLWRDLTPYPGIDLMVVNRAGRIVHPPSGHPLWEGKPVSALNLPDWPPRLPAQAGAESRSGSVTGVDFAFDHDGESYHAYLSWLDDQEWSLVSLHRGNSPLAGYLQSKRLGLKLFLPLAVLTIIGGLLALRSQHDRLRLQDSETRLQQVLGSTELQVECRTRLLTESELRYRALFEESPNGVVIIDESGRILEFNRVAATILGYSETEFAGLSISDIEDPDTPEETHRHLGRIASTGHDTFETRLRSKSGYRVDMLVSVRRIDLSTGTALIGVWTDLTPVIQIQQLQKRLQTIVEASRDGIVLADHRGLIIYANPAIETLLGWKDSELRGRPVGTLTPADSQLAHALGFRKDQGDSPAINPGPSEIEGLHKGGRVVPIEITVTTWNENGHPIFGVVLRDVSERRQAQERLQFTQKMEAVGILAGGIAHDFNNLLAIMLGHSQLVLDRSKEGDPNLASAEKISKAVLKARALIKQLLDFSRATDEAPKALSLADELREVELLIRSSVPRQIELRLNTANTLGVIRAIPHQMQQVFINLINNACDAIGDAKGVVDVKLAEETVRQVIETADGHVKPGHYVVARVLDNGPGISEAIHDRIFLPFFTTKDVGRGTGLGLAVVRNIVRQSGGHVRVFNRLSGGACFELYFPTTETSPADSPLDKPDGEGRGETVWFVDDEPEVVDAYAQYLTQSGFRPRVFGSPADALAELRLHPDEPQIVISDLIMPGMDGLAFAHAAHCLVRNLPILLLTGRSERVTIDQMNTCGVAGLISKPAEPQLIAAEIRRTLDRSPRTGEQAST